MAGDIPNVPLPTTVENGVAHVAAKQLHISDASAKNALTAKSRGIRGGIHYTPDTPTPPKMHKGGDVPKDGPYTLKAGEHVLTEKEAKIARKHAILASGLKSLAKSAKSAKKG